MSNPLAEYTSSLFISGLTQFGPLIPVIIPVIINLWITSIDQISVSEQAWNSEYDFVIVGGGAAGSALASQLAHERDYRVLLIEAGGNENIISQIPAVSHILQDTPLDWGYATEPQANACLGLVGRQSRWSRGKVVGGSSALNDMLYVNSHYSDFDRWEKIAGKQWSWLAVSKRFPVKEETKVTAKMFDEESYTAEKTSVNMLTVPTAYKPLTQAFLRSGRALNYSTFRLNTRSEIGFSVPQFTIDKGRRTSSAKVYLEPVRDFSNLNIINYALATKIIVENSVATGVQFNRFGSAYTVMARKEVILTAGAINSPQLLMLSGIGPEAHLKSLGIPVIQNLSVGHGLRDRYGTALSFTSAPNTAVNLGRDFNFMQLIKYGLFAEGVMSQPTIDAMAFVHTTDPNATAPNVQLLLQPFSIASDNGLVLRNAYRISDSLWNNHFRHYANRDTFSIVANLLRPKSVGKVELRSASPLDRPVIKIDYFSNDDDLKTITEALKLALRLVDSEPFKALKVSPFKTKIAGCEKYALNDDRYLKCAAKTLTLTANNPFGTCRMGSVVDSQLRVIGVQRLRVADASVVPISLSGCSYSTGAMIGQIAAEMIVEKDTNLELELWSYAHDVISELTMLSLDIVGKLVAFTKGDVEWHEMHTML